MMFLYRRGRMAASAVICALAASAACSDSGGKSPTQPQPGSLEVVVNGLGTDIDQRFSIQVNTRPEETYSMGLPFVREGLAAGAYTVRLSGISSNCTLQGANTVQVSVADGQRARASFAVTCAMRWLAATEFTYSGNTGSRIVRMNRDGSNRVVLTPGFSTEHQPSISPDGTRIAFVSVRAGNAEIYVMNADGSNPVRLTNLPSTHQGSPTWSPDGTRIAFTSDDYPSAPEVRVVNADGSGLTTLKADVAGMWAPLRWSPDGTRLAFVVNTPRGGGLTDIDLYTLVLATGTVARVTANPWADLEPSWMEDGRLVYLSATPGVDAGIFAANADGSGVSLLFDSPVHVETWPTMSADLALAYTAQPPGGGATELWIVAPGTGNPVKISTEVAHYQHLAWQP